MGGLAPVGVVPTGKDAAQVVRQGPVNGIGAGGSVDGAGTEMGPGVGLLAGKSSKRQKDGEGEEESLPRRTWDGKKELEAIT